MNVCIYVCYERLCWFVYIVIVLFIYDLINKKNKNRWVLFMLVVVIVSDIYVKKWNVLLLCYYCVVKFYLLIVSVVNNFIIGCKFFLLL